MKKLLLYTTLFLMGCEKDNLPEFNRLEGLRVLAFQANTPEVSPGSSVTITPIISDITATSLSFSVSACLDLGLSYGAEPTCEGSASKVTIAINTALTLPGAGESWTGFADSFSVTIPNDTVIFAGKSAAEKYNGVNYIITYTLTNNLGQSLTAVKRILVSETAKTAKNNNPVTAQIFANGAAFATMTLGIKQNLSTDLTSASAENYITKDAQLNETARAEKLTTTWFVTDGETKYYRSSGTDVNQYTSPGASAIGRSMYVMAITHDNRGGVSLVKKKF